METLKEVIKKYDNELKEILDYFEVEEISKIHNVHHRTRAETIRDILHDLKNL